MHVRDYWTPLVPIFSKGYGPYHSPSKHTLTPRITSSSIPESSTTSYILSTTANPTSLTSSEVPPTTTTFLPSAETVTSFVTLTASLPPYNYDIFKPLEDLSPCAQTIIYPRIANSECNPADFACICEQLQRLRIRDDIAATCKPGELQQYDDFFRTNCQNISPPPLTPASTSATPLSTDVPDETYTAEGPFNTTILCPESTELPVPEITIITATDVYGEPTTVVSTAVGPSSTSEPFIGGAAAVEVLAFGKLRASMLVGAIGIIGLVFAEL